MLSQFCSKLSRSVSADEQSNLGKLGIAFAVDSVTPAGKPIWTETLADSLAGRFQRKILALPQEQLQVTNATFFEAEILLATLDQILPVGSTLRR
jgi:hypothetical protein